MKRNIVFFLTFFLIVSFCFADKFFIEKKYIKDAQKHVFGIVITYQFDDEGYEEYLILKKEMQKKLPMQHTVKKIGDHHYVRTLGTASVISYEQLITVWHIFSFVPQALNYWAYVHNGKLSKQVKIVILGNRKNDYAVVKFINPQKFKGLRIAKKDLEIGEKIMWIGNGDCIAFNERYDFVGDLSYYFDQNRDFSIIRWPKGPFHSFKPIAKGDSGASLINEKGQIAGIIFLGFFTRDLSIGVSQPVSKLRKFLDKHKIKYK